MKLIEARGLKKSFRIPSERRDTVREHILNVLRPRHFQTLAVLDGIDLDLRPGETLGIMGRNGSGKSTLLRILAGIYLPDAGTVSVRAPITPILELGVGWNPELDAIDNIFLIGAVMGMTLHEIRRSVDEILAFADLSRFAHLELKHYSSGMGARLAYSIAFRAVRDVLILDEIFAVGDAGFRARCEARYRDLHEKGHSAILVSHDPRIVSTFCTRALLIDSGRIVREGPPAEIVQGYLALVGKP